MDVKAYESRKHVLNMLERRGYVVDIHKNYSLTEIKMMYKDDDLDFIVEKQDGTQKCYVKYYICKKCRCNDLKKIVLSLYDNELGENDELIVICKENIRITNKNGSNPTDAGSLIFEEAGDNWGSSLFGFRIKLQ